jgi:hypothetical protein
MGGAGKRSSVARNSVGGLVMVESILFKRLSIRAQGWWNGAAKTIPAVLHEILCSAATDRVAQVLGCAERATVFAGLAGQMYALVPGPNQFQSRAVALFFERSMFLYIKPQDKLIFSEEDARREQENGTIKQFIPNAELKRRASQGEFGDLFVMVLCMIAERNAWSSVTWPLIAVLDVTDVKDLKESVVKLMMETYPQLCNKTDKLTFSTFFDPEVRLASDNRINWRLLACAAQ